MATKQSSIRPVAQGADFNFKKRNSYVCIGILQNAHKVERQSSFGVKFAKINASFFFLQYIYLTDELSEDPLLYTHVHIHVHSNIKS